MSFRPIRALFPLVLALQSATALAEPGYFLRVIKPDGTSSLSGRPAYESASPGEPTAPTVPDAPGQPPKPGTVEVALSPGAGPFRLRVGDVIAVNASAPGLSGAAAWSLSPGSVPPSWLSYAEGSAFAGGTATSPGSGSFGFSVKDRTANLEGVSPLVNVVVAPALVAEARRAAYDARVGIAFSADAPVVGNAQGEVGYSAAAPLPDGLSLTSEGVVQGLPQKSTAGAAVSLTAEDAWDRRTAASTYQVRVFELLQFMSGQASLAGNVGTAVNLPAPPIVGNAGTVGYTLRQGAVDVGGTLQSSCPGIRFEASSGSIAGTPTEPCDLKGLTLVARDAGTGTLGPTEAVSTPFNVTVDGGIDAPPAVTLTTQTTSQGACTPVTVTNRSTAQVTGMSWAISPSGQGVAPCTPTGSACTGTLAGNASCVYGAQLVGTTSGTFSATGTVTASDVPAKAVSLSGTSTYAPPPGAGAVRPSTYYLQETNSASTSVDVLYDSSDATSVLVGQGWLLELRYNAPVTASKIKFRFSLGAKAGLYSSMYLQYWDASRNDWRVMSGDFPLNGGPAGKFYEAEVDVPVVSSDRFRIVNGSSSALPIYTYKIGDASGFPP